MWAEIGKKSLPLKSKVVEELSVWSKPKYSDEFANYIDYLQGNEPNTPKVWDGDKNDKLIRNSYANDIPDQMRRQEDQNCSTTIMEYLSDITGGNKDRHFYEKQAIERFGRNVLELGLDPGQVSTMVSVNFDRSLSHEVAIKKGENYKKAIDNWHAVMTNIDVPDAVGFPDGTKVMHNVLVVGYTDDNKYIYMDPDVGKLMVSDMSNFKRNNKYVYHLPIKIK